MRLLTGLRKIQDGVLSILHQLGWGAGDFTVFKKLPLRAGLAKREVEYAFCKLQNEPYIALVVPTSFTLPPNEDLYNRYLDFNFETWLLFRQFKDTSPGIAYMLIFDEQRAYLYDVAGQECLIYCAHVRERLDHLFPYLEKRKVQSGGLDNLIRKTNTRLSAELNGWLHLWSAKLGAKTNARKITLEKFCKKLTLARYYRILFGPETPTLRFESFVQDPSQKESVRRVSFSEYFQQIFKFFLSDFSLDYFEISKAENSFLMKLDSHADIVNSFLSEFNFLSPAKFSLDVLLNNWCSEQERLCSTKKTYTTDRGGIKKRLFVSGGVVIKPVISDIAEDGAPWALHLFDEVVQYWRSHNCQARDKRKKKGVCISQLDMFAPMPEETDADGCILNIVNHALKTSFRVLCDDQKETCSNFIFLLIAKCFELWKKYELPREPLAALNDIFQKPVL